MPVIIHKQNGSMPSAVRSTKTAQHNFMLLPKKRNMGANVFKKQKLNDTDGQTAVSEKCHAQ